MKVRQLQNRLWAAAKQSESRRFHALHDPRRWVNPDREGGPVREAAAGLQLRLVALDVTEGASVREAFEKAGDIEVLVNNAGVGWFGSVEETALAATSAYAASKVALESVSEVTAIDGRSHGIRVVVIETGATATPMGQKVQPPSRDSRSMRDTLTYLACRSWTRQSGTDLGADPHVRCRLDRNRRRHDRQLRRALPPLHRHQASRVTSPGCCVKLSPGGTVSRRSRLPDNTARSHHAYNPVDRSAQPLGNRRYVAQPSSGNSEQNATTMGASRRWRSLRSVLRPLGTVTFLFTDIEGSTRRWEADSDAMRSALAAHDAVLYAAVEAHGGWLFKHTGDGVCAAFGSARGRSMRRSMRSAGWGCRCGWVWPRVRRSFAGRTISGRC